MAVKISRIVGEIAVLVCLLTVFGAVLFWLDARFERRYRQVVQELVSREVLVRNHHRGLLDGGRITGLESVITLNEPKICLLARPDQCYSCQVDAVSRVAVLGEKVGFDRVCVLCEGFSPEGFDAFARGIDTRMSFVALPDGVHLPVEGKNPTVLSLYPGYYYGRKQELGENTGYDDLYFESLLSASLWE